MALSLIHICIGYAEQNFILAEAALRTWITGDAAEYYKKGIEASMKFVADNTPDAQKYHHGRKMTSDIIAQTLAKQMCIRDSLCRVYLNSPN